MIIIGLAETNHSLSWSSWLKNTSHKFTDIHDHHWIGWNQSFLIMIIMAKKTSHKFTDIHDHHWIGWNQSFLIMIIMAKKHHTNSLTFMIIIGLAETNHSLSWSSWLKKTSHKFTDIHDHHWIGWNQSFLIMIIMAKKHITQIHWHSWSSLDWLKPIIPYHDHHG